MEHKHTVLRDAVQCALRCEDMAWYRETLQADCAGCSLTFAEEQAIVTAAMHTAQEIAQKLRAAGKNKTPQELVQDMGLSVLHVQEELREPFLYLGLYDPDLRTITLNDAAIQQVQRFIECCGLADLTLPQDVEKLALYHEIFHAIEEETPQIYTRSKMLSRKRLGIFAYQRGLDGASEVGAIHFSKCMGEVLYSPCIYERYLLRSLNRKSIDFFAPNVYT